MPRHPAFPPSQGPNVQGTPLGGRGTRGRRFAASRAPPSADPALPRVGAAGMPRRQVGGKWAGLTLTLREGGTLSLRNLRRCGHPRPGSSAPAGLSPRREMTFCQPSTGQAAPSASPSPGGNMTSNTDSPLLKHEQGRCWGGCVWGAVTSARTEPRPPTRHLARGGTGSVGPWWAPAQLSDPPPPSQGLACSPVPPAPILLCLPRPPGVPPLTVCCAPPQGPLPSAPSLALTGRAPAHRLLRSTAQPPKLSPSTSASPCPPRLATDQEQGCGKIGRAHV